MVWVSILCVPYKSVGCNTLSIVVAYFELRA